MSWQADNNTHPAQIWHDTELEVICNILTCLNMVTNFHGVYMLHCDKSYFNTSQQIGLLSTSNAEKQCAHVC